MKEKRLIICDDDREFISRLGGYISRKRENPLQVACFTEREAFGVYLSEHEVDGVLIGEHWSENGESLDCVRTMLLTERIGQSAAEGCIEIYKYQSAEDILRQVMLGLELPDGGQTVFRGDAELFCVYSPGGWSEVTRLALAIAKRLGRDGPVIYLGLNEFSAVNRLLGKMAGQDMSDVVYCRRRGKINEARLEKMILHLEGFDCIPAPVNPAELAELKEKDIKGLVEDVCRVGGYRHAVLDLGGSVFGWLSLFGAAKQNYVIFPGTETGLYQQSVYETFWKSIGAEALLEKSKGVILPSDEVCGGKREKTEEYINELAERLLRSKDKPGGDGGTLI